MIHTLHVFTTGSAIISLAQAGFPNFGRNPSLTVPQRQGGFSFPQNQQNGPNGQPMFPVAGQLPVQAAPNGILELREQLWNKYIIEPWRPNFNGMLNEARQWETRTRAPRLVQPLTAQLGLQRGGTAPEVAPGRGIFSDEDLECLNDQCIERLKILAPRFGFQFRNEPLFLEIPQWDVLIWKPDREPDFCAQDEWRTWMFSMAEEKEKSLVARAESLKLDYFAEPIEVVLESISKARDYLKPNVFFKTKGFVRWDKFAQLCKALYRAIQKAELGEMSGFNVKELYAIAKMNADPCALKMCNRLGKFDVQLSGLIMERYRVDASSGFEKALESALRLLDGQEYLIFGSNNYDRNGKAVSRSGSGSGLARSGSFGSQMSTGSTSASSPHVSFAGRSFQPQNPSGSRSSMTVQRMPSRENIQSAPLSSSMRQVSFNRQTYQDPGRIKRFLMSIHRSLIRAQVLSIALPEFTKLPLVYRRLQELEARTRIYMQQVCHNPRGMSPLPEVLSRTQSASDIPYLPQQFSGQIAPDRPQLSGVMLPNSQISHAGSFSSDGSITSPMRPILPSQQPPMTDSVPGHYVPY